MINPYNVPKKIKGRSLDHLHIRASTPFQQAVKELAKIESEKTGKKISQSVIVVDLSTRNGDYFAAQRSWLRQRTIQLNREQQHDHKAVQTNQGIEGN